MKDLLVGLIVITGLVLLLLVLISCCLYLAWRVLVDANDFYDYFENRTPFRLWKWMKEQEEREPLEVREQRCLAELNQIREEKSRREREGRRPAMQVYTFCTQKKPG